VIEHTRSEARQHRRQDTVSVRTYSTNPAGSVPATGGRLAVARRIARRERRSNKPDSPLNTPPGGGGGPHVPRRLATAIAAIARRQLATVDRGALRRADPRHAQTDHDAGDGERDGDASGMRACAACHEGASDAEDQPGKSMSSQGTGVLLNDCGG
jgi:hypothetical protein